VEETACVVAALDRGTARSIRLQTMNGIAILSADERDRSWLQRADDRPTLTLRNFFHDGDSETPTASPQVNGFVPPMDMKQMSVAAENWPAIARFEPKPCERLILKLTGMSFRTFHFDEVSRAAGYVQWMWGWDMRETYTSAIEVFAEIYPNAKILRGHRDPAKVLGAVCSLIAVEQLTWWAEAIKRAMGFQGKFGGDRFVDDTVARSYAQLGFTFSDHKPRHRGPRTYGLADDGLTPGRVREAFANYLGTYDASA
jgi:hypothetical protein